MGVEVVHDEHNFRGICQQSVRQMDESGGEIRRSAASVATHGNIALSQMRHGDHQSTHTALAEVFVVFTGEVRRRWFR